MKKPRAQNPATTKKLYYIYVIYKEETNQIYVDYTEQYHIEKVHQHHFSLKDDCTKKLFVSSNDYASLPKMYIIDRFGDIPSRAFTSQLLWMRYFISNGLNCINSKNEIECIREIYGVTKKLYSEVFNKKLEEVFTDEEEITPAILAQHVPSKTAVASIIDSAMDTGCTITFKSKLAYREMMHAHAKSFGIPMSSYLTQVGVMGSVLTVDYSIVREHTQTLSLYQQELQAVLKLLIDQKQLDDRTLKKILDIIHDTYESEKNFLEAFIEEESKRKKEIFDHIYKKLFEGGTEHDL